MHKPDISDMPVATIMQYWPNTIHVFLRARLHCVGCPISGFHTIPDAAREHEVAVALLEAEILVSILASQAD